MRTALNALQTQYLVQGHEVVLIRPGIDSCLDDTNAIKDFTIRGPVLPMTGGYRVIAGRRELKHILLSLRPDVVELSDKFDSVLGAEMVQEEWYCMCCLFS